jgi:gamma-glutamylcyclotransferase (GGCT)/AIG2-like uncharacterized protein YtfP
MFGLRKKKELINGETPGFTAWLNTANRSGLFTPDMWRLQQKKNHHVFLYGDSMEGHHNHFKHVGNAPYLGIAYTFNRDFIMWKKSVGDESFPFILRGVASTQVGKGRVKGELYDLTPRQVIQLDEYMLNTVQFNRVRLKVTVPHIVRRLVGDKVTQTLSVFPPIESWVYVGKTDYWEDLLDGGYRYPVVKSGHTNPSFKVFNNSFHYSVQEHNDFKVNPQRTVP